VKCKQIKILFEAYKIEIQ